jgi:hypothetical protein
VARLVPGLAEDTVLIVDAANVVGSVPDGWWRDRAGATRRLRDRLPAIAAAGLPGIAPPVEVILVVEGAARGVEEIPGVRVVAASGSGDDAIVKLVREAPAGSCVVVTADRGLADRVRSDSAHIIGPRTLLGR